MERLAYLLPLYDGLYIKKQRIETNINCRRTAKVSITNALKNKNVILLFIGNLCSSYAYWLFLTWLHFYFIKVKNLSLSEMSIATSASFISGVTSVMLGGIISDLMIKKRFSAITSHLTPIIIRLSHGFCINISNTFYR